MEFLYYTQVNLMCIVILLLIKRQSHFKSKLKSNAQLIFDKMIWASVVLCASDMAAFLSTGKSFAGAGVVVEVSNIIYFESMVVIGYLWTLYTDSRLNELDGINRKRHKFYAIPLILFSAVILTNPITHYVYTIDETNTYARNFGTYFHWAVVWSYLIWSTLQIARAALREKNKLKQQEIQPMLYFIVAPIVGGIAQMLFYGVTATQAGITISLIMIFMAVQGSQILTDALTGLSNRRGLEKYLQEHIQHHEGEDLSLLMIDINGFKQINDRYGHAIGDVALKKTAAALKKACRGVSHRPFLCRYGGDEFVIAGLSGRNEVNRLVTLICNELRSLCIEEYDFKLEVSVGSATGKCYCTDDAEKLMAKADSAMYKNKYRTDR